LKEEEITPELKEEEKKLKKAIAQTIKDVTQELSDYSFNTAIAHLMSLSNVIGSSGKFSSSTELLKNFDRNLALELPIFKQGINSLST